MLGPILAQALGWLVDTIVSNIPVLLQKLLEGLAWVQETVIGKGLAGLARWLAESLGSLVMSLVTSITEGMRTWEVNAPWGKWHPFSDIAPAVEGLYSEVFGEEGLLIKGVDKLGDIWTGMMSLTAEGTRQGADLIGSDFMRGLFDDMGDSLGASVESGVQSFYGEAIPGLLRDAATGLRSEGTQAAFGNMASGVENFEFNLVIPGSKKHIGQVSVDRKNKKISEEYGSDTYLQSYGTQTINITPEGSSMDLWDLN